MRIKLIEHWIEILGELTPRQFVAIEMILNHRLDYYRAGTERYVINLEPHHSRREMQKYLFAQKITHVYHSSTRYEP